MCRSTAHFLFYGARAQKPSAEMKRSFRGKIAHALFCFGFWKGCLPFCGQKPHASRPFFFSFGAEKTVQESSCFIEQPLHTQSGLRAGSPRARKAFQGFPTTHPDHSWTFGAWIGSTDLPCGFCLYYSPSLSKRPIHRLYIAAARKSPPFPLSLL